MELPIFYDEAEEWSNALLLYNSALKEINTKLEILNNELSCILELVTTRTYQLTATKICGLVVTISPSKAQK